MSFSSLLQGVLVFEPGETMKEITIKIVDDDMSEPDVMFTVALTAACIDGGDEVVIMRKTTAVTIVDDDDGGVLVFELPTFEVRGSPLITSAEWSDGLLYQRHKSFISGIFHDISHSLTYFVS